MVTKSTLLTVSYFLQAFILRPLLYCSGLLLLLLGSCDPSASSSNEITFNTRPYYFPIDDLKAGWVYEYHTIQNGNGYLSHFWHLTSVIDANDTFLIWKRYNPLFEQDQYIKEQIFATGAMVKEYYLYAYDSSRQQRQAYAVQQSAIFPFQAATDSNMVYRYSASMTLPPDFVTVRLNRDRRFEGVAPKPYSFEDQSLPAIVFQSKDVYDLEDTTEGGFWSDERRVYEYYAQGLGLVETQEWSAGSPTPSIIRLVKRHRVPVFDRLRQAALKSSD